MIEKKLFDEIDRIDIPEILSDLVSIPSYDSEQGVVEYIIQRLKKIDAEYEIREVAPTRQNLIASISNKGKTLIFNTHTDTVPPGIIENWTVPPLKLTRKGDELFGLGSCDAKGSLVSMLTAFEVLARNSFLNGRLTFQAVCCEESRARGTLAEAARGVSADAAIVGEPTELVPMIGHKGAIGLEIAVYGKSTHASSPEEGVNAISSMAKVIGALDALAEKISIRRDPLFGNASLAVTQIHGGQAPNVIPDNCVIVIDRRLIPGETTKDALSEISAIICRDEAFAHKCLIPTIEEKIAIEPCMISPEEPIVKVVRDSVARVTGEYKDVSWFTACCDMWCLVQKANIPTVILGPGKLSVAHKADESISVDELYKAAKIYTAIAINWFG